MQEHAQRETNKPILAGLRIIEFGNHIIQSLVPLIKQKPPCLYHFKSAKADVGRSQENEH